MLKKDSYILDTFTGLRVSEIQKKTMADNWIHVPSKENVADVLTKGASPDFLVPGSVWQSGPAQSTSTTEPTDPPLDAHPMVFSLLVPSSFLGENL